jgi:5-methylcytosine-specific restriction endonuclease McrA
VEKQCSRCGQVKPVSDFGKRPANRDGYEGVCKRCRCEGQKRRNRENPERYRENLRRYRNSKKCQEYIKQYKEENKEKMRAYHKQYYEENKERYSEQGKQYYQENKKKVLKRCKKYRQTHKAERNEALKDWVRRNPEKRRKQMQRYREKNGERRLLMEREYSRKRRAIKANADGFYTKDQWLELLEVCDNQCLKCGATENIEADHVKPLSRGGSDWITNIQPLCRPCNCEKHAHTADYRPMHVKQWAKRAREAREKVDG